MLLVEKEVHLQKYNLGMEMQEAKLYIGNRYLKSLCLIGDNDDFDEIVVENDGTMTVRTIETVMDKNDKDDPYKVELREYKGITRINFK